MENKKQLIIIPPMSEALKKLNEVLEGISGDENVEISMIDDLKELSQFIATTGQCLILASNAKKCATFLQENKSMLAKGHCKTILFTPKEIPAKTLIKFTKIGLTESILESSPPKTFLYKVKLLLRSIKTARPQEDAEKLVKSLENGKTQNEEISDRDVKEKFTTEENVIDMDMGKKKRNDDSGESIDYSNPLKGKIRPQEETIDTNWKSDRKKHADIEKTEEENMTAESEHDSIDMYYRGKNKKLDTMLETAEDDFGKLKKVELVDQDSPAAKKSSYADVIDEGSMKQKKLDQANEEIADEEKESSVELDLLASAKKNKKTFDDIDSDLELSMNRRRQQEAEEDGKKTKDKDAEDLGGYLKGKISKDMILEEEPEITPEAEYDNSEVEEEDRDKDFDLDLLAGDKKNRKQDEGAGPEDNVHDGEVDQIEGNMIGDSGTVDKIRTRMSGSSDGSGDALEDEDDGLILYSKNKKTAEKESDEEEETDSLNLEAAKKAKEKTETKKEDEEEIELKKPQQKLDLIEGDKKNDLTPSADPEERERQKQAFLEKLKAEKAAKAAAAKEDNEDLDLRSRESSGIKLKKDGNQTHDGQVDKIDTFYRSGDSKKQDHSWDNLTDKKATLELLPGQKRSGMSTVAADNKDLGETTIDYRKLKEELDMMSSGGVINIDSGAFSTTGDTKLKNNDDDGSFKVIEIDPKSLDFSIAIINSIYNKDAKAKQIFAMITDELVDNYHCYPVFYSYKLSDKKFTEAFNSFVEINGHRMPTEKKDWWNEFKKDTAVFEHYQTKSMTTWRCPEIVNNNEVWEDVELPTWAEQELKNKHVELIFPYFDGLDRMGLAEVMFLRGLNPKKSHGILKVLEMARTMFLDTIQRYQVVPVKEKELVKEVSPVKEEIEKKNVLSFFSGLFGKKKAG